MPWIILRELRKQLPRCWHKLEHNSELTGLIQQATSTHSLGSDVALADHPDAKMKAKMRDWSGFDRRGTSATIDPLGRDREA